MIQIPKGVVFGAAAAIVLAVGGLIAKQVPELVRYFRVEGM